MTRKRRSLEYHTEFAMAPLTLRLYVPPDHLGEPHTACAVCASKVEFHHPQCLLPEFLELGPALSSSNK